MRSAITILIIFPILALSDCKTAYLTTCSNCNINYLVIAEKNPNDSNIKKALCTMSNECINNVEFTEFSNELLFFFLEKEVDITVREISKLSKDKQDFIISLIAHPINDGIHLNLIKERVQILKGKNENENKIIKNILNSLNKL